MAGERTKNGYLPPGLWYAMVEIAMTNGIALKEVEVTLIRRILETDFGFKCNHPEEKIRVRNKTTVYCTHCWTRLVIERRSRLDPTNRTKVLPSIYAAKPTFFDKKKEEEEQVTVGPSSSLIPDPRGGE